MLPTLGPRYTALRNAVRHKSAEQAQPTPDWRPFHELLQESASHETSERLSRFLDTDREPYLAEGLRVSGHRHDHRSWRVHPADADELLSRFKIFLNPYGK